MGYPIAANLLKAQLPLTVFDVRAEPVAELGTRGSAAASSAAELARRCDLIGVCVVNDAQVLDVVSGPAGLLAGARPGSVVMLHSTIYPDTCREVERRCAEHGVEVLEVTVSGYSDKAASADLTLMIGGSDEVMARCEPYLSAIGKHRFHLGPVGAGNAAKLANNVMAIFGKLGAYEGLNVARANGIDVGKMVDVAMVSTGYSEALRQWKVQGLRHETVPGSWEGVAGEGRRILATALAVSREHDVNLPVVAAVLDLMDQSGIPEGVSRW
jgi:3-hydroxyisobutyrate dehydrogenase-like beta-hydroxyacid dehydrogenase